MIPEYSIYDTKAHLSKVLKIVKSGQEVIVTERGEPIAKLIPFLKKEETFEERIKRMEKEGTLIRPKGKPNFQVGKRVPGGLEQFLEERKNYRF
jgi:prevent-host-death family protein